MGTETDREQSSASGFRDEDPISRLLELADQCVKCGYCLPHCPTFRLANEEGESPRGRIALIQGWLGHSIPDSIRLDTHLSNCLACRACEPACPSLVRFGALLDGARCWREQRHSAPRRWLRRARLNLLVSPIALRLLGAIGAGYRWIHPPAALLHRIGRWWPLLRVLDGVVRTLQWPTTTPAPDDYRSVASRTDDAPPAFVDSGPDRAGKAAASERPVLFLGCIARISQQATEAAALHVLLHLGCSVEVVLGQTCCGAIHRHNGFPEQAQGLLEANRRAFGPRTVIGFASACIAELQEHGDLRPVEICRFLADLDWPEEIKLAPLNATVAVHEPCSHRNLLRDQHSVYALLQRIPKLSIRALAGNELCCGAAGTYLIQQPATAIALAEPKIEALRMLRPRYLVTTNTGCALHLGARVREADLDIEVIHPVELIARQLITQG